MGATDANNQRASFSTTGPYVNVVAPGVDIISIDSSGSSSRDGTSFSTPYVSAAAAIVRATQGFNANQVYWSLIASATDLGPPGWDPEYGAGLINVPAAAP